MELLGPELPSELRLPLEEVVLQLPKIVIFARSLLYVVETAQVRLEDRAEVEDRNRR